MEETKWQSFLPGEVPPELVKLFSQTAEELIGEYHRRYDMTVSFIS